MTVRVMLFNLHGDEDKKGANGVDALRSIVKTKIM